MMYFITTRHVYLLYLLMYVYDICTVSILLTTHICMRCMCTSTYVRVRMYCKYVENCRNTLLEYSTLGQVFLVIAAVVCHWDDHVSRATCRLAIDIDHYRSKMIHLRFHLCIPLCLSVSEESSNPVFIWFFLALLSSCACSAFRFRWHDEVVFVSALDWVRGLCQFSDFTNGTEQICACVCVWVCCLCGLCCFLAQQSFRSVLWTFQTLKLEYLTSLWSGITCYYY